MIVDDESGVAQLGPLSPEHFIPSESVMPDIYLHIGRGKTGTTSIQRYLSARRADLLSQGIHYVLADDAGSGSGHQRFAKSFISNPPDHMDLPVDPNGIRREVFEEISGTNSPTVLLSSENFPLADVPAVIRFFQSLPRPSVLKIILIVRSQDELAESEYNQMVKLKREASSFAEYISEKLDGCNFFEVASMWERHLGKENMICQIYDGAKRDVVRQFLSCLPGAPLPVSLPHEARSSNASIGFKALTLARLLNSTEVADLKALYESLFEQLADNDLPALLFDSREAEAFRSRFADSNRAFTERFLGLAQEDLGGRAYSDRDRDEIRARIKAMRLDSL